ncbi:MAG: hypothetical protein LBI44_08325 [Oscillospiraceae bacterium]|nr:hypothetical protein [Oscillospiraceae bacterium]
MREELGLGDGDGFGDGDAGLCSDGLGEGESCGDGEGSSLCVGSGSLGVGCSEGCSEGEGDGLGEGEAMLTPEVTSSNFSSISPFPGKATRPCRNVAAALSVCPRATYASANPV